MIIFKIIITFIINGYFFSNLYAKSNLELQNCEESNKDFIQQTNYLLGPGDKVYINFFGYKDLSGEFNILNDGKLSLPLIGSVFVSGLNTEAAIKKLEQEYKKELLSSKLDIQIINSRPLNVSIIGEVKHPGPYKLKKIDKSIEFPRSFNEYPYSPKLTDAIEYSGGLTKDSDLTKICLKRKFNLNSKIAYKKKRLNLFELLNNGKQENNPYLQDEDIIYIGKIDKNSNPYLFNNSLSSKFNYINVLGEVINPGLVKVQNNGTILDAISAAGGLKDFTTNGYGKLIRIKEDGKNYKEIFKIDFKNNKNVKGIQLKDGDTIFISKNSFSKASTIIKNVTDPFVNIWQIFALNNYLKN